MTVRDDVSRNPSRGRHTLMAISGCVVIALGLLYAGLPRIAQISFCSIGILNLLLGISGLLPRERVRLARALRVAAYLAFFAGLALIGIMLVVASDH